MPMEYQGTNRNYRLVSHTKEIRECAESDFWETAR